MRVSKRKLATLLFSFLVAIARGDTEEDALLEAIQKNPAEDTPRLMYADWLDEHDRAARAEFIRIDVEWFRIKDEASDTQRKLRDRRQELLRKHRAEWLPAALSADEILFGSESIEWERGFPGKIRVSRLELLHDKKFVAGLNALPVVSRVCFVGLFDQFEPEPEDIRALTLLKRVPTVEFVDFNPHAPRLRRMLDAFPANPNLSLHITMNPEVMRAVVQSKLAATLTSLEISPLSRNTDTPRVLPTDALQVLSNSRLPELRTLRLEGVETLPALRAQELPKLKHVYIVDFSPEFMQAANVSQFLERVRAFWARPITQQLIYLRLPDMYVRPTGVNAAPFEVEFEKMAQSPHQLAFLYRGFYAIDSPALQKNREKMVDVNVVGRNCREIVQALSER